MSFAEVVLLELVLVTDEGLGDGVGLDLFVGLFVHPELAVAFFLDFDPVFDAVGGEDEGGLLRVAVTHC